MAYLVVPHEVSASTATIWIGAIDERFSPGQVRLVSHLGEHILADAWEHWVAREGTHHLDYQRVTITGLQPRTPMTVQLLVNGQPQADARLTTLPPQLPTLEEKPFTVLLGSCFCKREDDEGAVGRTYAQLPAGSRPDVKILCGDQVYLDDPWAHYLWHTHDIPELEGEFFRNYRDTWMQEPGFRQLLTQGANYFSPDDHEYWNNAPDAATVIRDTWSRNGRQEWFTTARQFYQMFQNPAPITTFTVDPLSFLIADTRSNRSSNQTDFMQQTDLQAVAQWIQNLPGPASSSSGSHSSAEKPAACSGPSATGICRTITSMASSPDCSHNRPTRSSSSLAMCITVASPGVPLISGGELIEVISSPMSLVDKKPKVPGKRRPPVPAFRPSGGGQGSGAHACEETRFHPSTAIF